MQQPEVDYSRKWYVMAAVTMSIFLATIDGSIVNVALPTLVRNAPPPSRKLIGDLSDTERVLAVMQFVEVK